MRIWRDYWSWQPWMRWFVPLSLLLRISRQQFGRSHVWWQGENCQLELRPRFADVTDKCPECGKEIPPGPDYCGGDRCEA